MWLTVALLSVWAAHVQADVLIAVAASGGGDSLSHGDSHTVTGSGFGTRANIYKDIFDDCSNASVSTLWNDATGGSYQTVSEVGESIAMPHSNVDHYYAGEMDGVWNYWLSTYVTGITYPTNLYSAAYRRVDPDWTFGTSCDCTPSCDDDDNFKYFTVSGGTSWFSSPYWYHDQTGQKCSKTGTWTNSFYSSGNLGNLDTQSGSQGGSSAQSEDPWYSWVKFEYKIELDSSGASLDFVVNNSDMTNLTNQNTFDAGGTDGAFSVGAYVRQDDHAGNWLFMVDVAMVIGDGAFARVMLCDTNSISTATLCEYQPITSWSASSIGITVNKGAHANGTAYLLVINSSDSQVANEEVTLQ